METCAQQRIKHFKIAIDPDNSRRNGATIWVPSCHWQLSHLVAQPGRSHGEIVMEFVA